MNHTLRSAPLLALAMLALEGCDTAPRLLGDGPVALEGVDVQLRAQARFAGDVDGDGYDDVLVWNDVLDPQRVAVIRGRPGVGVLTADALASGEEGLVVRGGWTEVDGRCDGDAHDMVEASPLGDVDGDGQADFAVLEQPAGQDTARVTVVFGTTAQGELDLETVGAGAGGFRIDLQHTSVWDDIDVEVYWSMGSLGDVDGDGLDDLLVRSANNGKAGFIVFGKADGTPVTISSTGDPLLDPAHGLLFNLGIQFLSATGIGDFDGDGHDDVAMVVVGGEVLVFRGGPMADLAFSREDAWLTIEEPGEPAEGILRLAAAVRPAGDIDGDGLADLLFGEPWSQAEPTYVVHGTPEGGVLTREGLKAGEGGFAVYGREVDFAGAGDIDGDGLDDLLLGAFYANIDDVNDTEGPGGTYVAFGRAGTEATSFAALSSGNGGFRVAQEPELLTFGHRVDGGGDFNGDGLDDLIIGARLGDAERPWGCDDGQSLAEGRVLIRFAPKALP